MTNRLLAVGLAACLVGGASIALAGKQDFTLINKTGFTIDQVYVDLSTEDSWGEDVLDQDQLPSGEEQEITFTGYDDTDCMFDVLLVDTKGVKWEVEGIDLCKIHKVTFKKEKGKVIYYEE
jgi:hypothetical protein